LGADSSKQREREGKYHPLHTAMQNEILNRVSVWVVSFDNIVIMLAAFVVCRLIPATQGTFRWRAPSLIAIFAVM